MSATLFLYQGYNWWLNIILQHPHQPAHIQARAAEDGGPVA